MLRRELWLAGFHACLLCLILASPAVATTPTTIEALPTADTAVLGRFARGPFNVALRVSALEFDTIFGSGAAASWPAEAQARQFFANGGNSMAVVRVSDTGSLADALSGGPDNLTGIHALTPLSNLRLLVSPELTLLPDTEFTETFARFRAFLEPRRILFLMDPPPGLPAAKDVVAWVELAVPIDAWFCVLYFPYLRITVDGVLTTLPASGAMAGVYNQVDRASGIWRSPAGTAWPIQAKALVPQLTDADFDQLNAHNISSIREFAAAGIVPWGARVLDRSNVENRYISVVRTRGWLAASIQRGLAFTAMEDNGEALWSKIRSTVNAFLQTLFQQGAFAGSTPAEAYFVRCDALTTTQGDIEAHRVNVLCGFAMLRAAEFDLTTLTTPTFAAGRKTAQPPIVAAPVQNDLLLAYPTEPGVLYQLEQSQDPGSGAWSADDTPTVTGDGAWRQLGFLITGPQRFYRLQATPIRAE